MADDLSDLFLARPSTPAQPMMYRTGVVKSWNPVDATNVVTVNGTDFTNLPILNTSEALILTPGDVVGIIDIGTTWAIIGRFTVPGTPAAATSLSAIGTVSDSVSAFESTTSGSWTDLTTLGPTVTIIVPRSGRVLVLLAAMIGWNPTANGGGDVSVALTGANTIGAGNGPILTFTQALSGGITSSVFLRSSTSYVFRGLTPGSTTFTCKYASEVSPTAAEFLDRSLVVIPL